MKPRQCLTFIVGTVILLTSVICVRAGTIRMDGCEWVTFGHISATNLIVESSATLSGTGTVHAISSVRGMVQPGIGTKTGTLAFTDDIRFVSGGLHCYAASNSALSYISSTGDVTGNGVVNITRAAGVEPLAQIVIAGGGNSDYSSFSSSLPTGWSLGESGSLDLWVTALADMTVLGANGAVAVNAGAASVALGTDFGGLPWNQSLTNTFSITNAGIVNLSISGVSTTGSGIAAFDIWGIPDQVDSGTVSNFSVAFNPTAAKTYEVALILNNDSTNTPYVINLAGTGEKRNQTISFTNPGTQITTNLLGLSVTATSGLSVTCRVVSGSATISGYTNVTFSGDGSMVIAADQVGNTNWNAALSVTNIFTINKAVATVGFAGLSTTYNGGAQTVYESTSPTGLTVNITYNGLSGGPTNAGSYQVIGLINDAMYSGGLTNTMVIHRAIDTITFGSINHIYDGTAKSVTSSSANSQPRGITYDGSSTSPTNAGPYTVVGTVNTLNWTGTNSTVMTIDKSSQTISFSTIGNKLTTDAVGLNASASSGLGVNFAVASGLGAINGGTNLTFSGAGSVSITASQAGDSNWLSAPTKTNTFSVSKDSQSTLVFAPASPQTYNTTNTLLTSGGAGTGVVSYAVLSGPGLIVGTTNLQATSGTGSIVVEATKAADTIYLVTSSSATVTVAKASQSISFTNPGDQFWTNTVGLLANSDSSLAVTFAVASGPATLAGGTNLSFSGYGMVVLTADQAGDSDWAVAPTITNTFNAIGPNLVVQGTNGAIVSSGNSPSILDGTHFGEILMGSVALTNSFTITNDGNATLTFSSVVTNGAQARSFELQSLGMTLEPSTSMVVTVTFDPQAGGSNDASFVFSFDGTNSPYTVNMTGFGHGADIGISTGSLSFAAAYAGSDPVDQMCSLTNAGVSGMTWTNATSYSSGAAGWLSVTPETSTLAMAEGVTLSASVDINGLNVGTYTATNSIIATDATNSPQSFVVQLTIGKASQSISFPNPGRQIVTNVTQIAATASSGLSVSLEVVSGPAVLSGTSSPAMLTYTAPGMVTLRATQLGDANWSAATAIQISFRAKVDRVVPCDYDGDGMSDLSVYWPEGGNWYIRYGGGGTSTQNWGWSETVPVPGDYDGDGITDIAVYWPADVTNNWYILQSSDGHLKFGHPLDWGWSAAVPVPGDYDGDGMTDIAVYWPEGGNWYIRYSGGGTSTQNWGWSETVPVPGDYDGDGITDIAVYWPHDGINNWFILQSSDGQMKFGGPVNWGWSGTYPTHESYWLHWF